MERLEAFETMMKTVLEQCETEKASRERSAAGRNGMQDIVMGE